jgi:hypothetical protein
MPSIDEIKRAILESESTDWRFFADPEVYVYRPDPRIRFEECGEDTPYQAPWLQSYHHSEDTVSRPFRVYFGSSPIDEVSVLRIDEDRFQIPEPKLVPDPEYVDARQEFDEVSITAYEEAIGRMMTKETFDSYMRLGNVEVRDGPF